MGNRLGLQRVFLHALFSAEKQNHRFFRKFIRRDHLDQYKSLVFSFSKDPRPEAGVFVGATHYGLLITLHSLLNASPVNTDSARGYQLPILSLRVKENRDPLKVVVQGR